MHKENLVKQLSLMATLLCVAVGVGAQASADVASTYQKSCAACHDSGNLSAPKKGDTQVWQKLKAQKGMDGLVKSTRQGMPQMPAMGLCQTCSDKEFAELIDYMSK